MEKKKCKMKLLGEPVVAKPVDECESISEVFEKSFTCFGGKSVKKLFSILKEVARKRIPTVIAVAGPITVSDQHRGWLIPLMKRLNVAYITVTDAICYHDGHDILRRTKQRVIRDVDMHGDDAKLLTEGIIRITDTGFMEKVLFDQDRMVTEILQKTEFQKSMTTTERNYLLGKFYAAQEREFEIRPGLLSTCCDLGIPVFIGAPADGSNFLNSVKLWAMNKIKSNLFSGYEFNIDLHQDVFEAAAYHYWGLFNSQKKSMAILILGGGVPKNYSLQPEPFLSQILLLDGIRGYDYDMQIVSAGEEEGSLTGAVPDEAVSWGKVNPKTYRKKTVSVRADYSMLMNPLAYAICDSIRNRLGPGLRLFEKREKLVNDLFSVIEVEKLKKTLNFPLALK